MTAIPTLAELAALRADADLAPARLPLPIRDELEYAALLFQRAERALSAELAILRGTDLSVDWMAVQNACYVLMGVAVQAHIRARADTEVRR